MAINGKSYLGLRHLPRRVTWLSPLPGISGKSVACLLLYCMRRLDFAVDANVLRVMTRLGWLK